MPTPRPTVTSAGGPIWVRVMAAVPADAAPNERAAAPPTDTCPANVSVTGDVVVGDVAVLASSQATAASRLTTSAHNAGAARRVMGG